MAVLYIGKSKAHYEHYTKWPSTSFRFTISTVNLHILDIRRHWKANMLADLSFPNIAISACHS
jgi:hypothetical protein